MIVKLKRQTLEQAFIVSFLIVVGVSFLIGVSFTTELVIGTPYNITNQTVVAIVNITNTEPNITAVTIEDNDTSPAGEIDLYANNETRVVCNATVFDHNGWADINANKTNATFHIQSVGRDGETDNNHRYRNESCGDCIMLTATTAACSCGFSVQYYANDSDNWLCNITVEDFGGTGGAINLTDTDVSSTTTVTDLLAIDTGPLIDYGNLSVTQTSAEIAHNVTNVGNIDLNLTLRSYGGIDETIGQNVTMICTLGNITFGNQRYAFGTHMLGNTAFENMTNVTNQTRNVNNSTLPQRLDDNDFGPDRNTTVWRLQVPLSVGGFCNGTIIFGAIDAEV